MMIVWMVALGLFGCRSANDTEKHQARRTETVDVRDRMEVIDIGDMLIGPIADLALIGDHVLVNDMKSFDHVVHIFDRERFRHVASRIRKGRGPGEIVLPGGIIVDEAHRKFYYPDHGKRKIFGYALDSLLADPDYLPTVAMQMDERLFPSEACFIGDDRLFGAVIEPVGSNNFKQALATWSMTTGEITRMPYAHPDVERPRIAFAVSVKHDLYVEIYHHHDLFTICSLDGTLKHNVYGPRWDATTSRKNYYFGKAVICGDKIVVSYSGKEYASDDYHPTKLMVFDLNGDYLKTLETGYQIWDFCYDEAYDRLLFSLNDVVQFAWLKLDGLI